MTIRVNDATSGSVAMTDSTGFFGATRAIASTKKAWKNGIQQGSDFAVASTGLPTQEAWICGASAANFGFRQIAAAAWGSSLAGKESGFYNAVLAYMQAVGAA